MKPVQHIGAVVLMIFIVATSSLYAADAGEYHPFFFATDAAEYTARHELLLRFDNRYYTDGSYVTAIPGKFKVRRLGDNHPVDAGVSQLLENEISLSYAMFDNLIVSGTLPVYTDRPGWESVRSALGDARFSLRYIPVGSNKGAYGLGGEITLIIPAGNSNALFFPHTIYSTNVALFDQLWRSQYLDKKFYLAPRVMNSFYLKNTHVHLPLEMHLNTGVIMTDNKEALTVTCAAALRYQFASHAGFSTELITETRPFLPGRNVANAISADPVRVASSVDIAFPHGIHAIVSGILGLSNGGTLLRSNWLRGGYAYATRSIPKYGAAISIVYSGNLLHMLQGTIFMQGLPGDHDADGIPDGIDACPNTPEDRDQFEDEDGCPDYDNDGDGIVDEKDACPNVPEDKDGFEDGDGCPDYDNDKDGIPDSVDACPDDSGSKEHHGCPDEGKFSFTRTVVQEISFEPGTSKMKSGSDILDRIAVLMNKYPKSAIEFQVHTDNSGESMESTRLSQNRADVLKLYLVTKGVKPGRIKALGLGSEFPIADNSTPEGRARNERVEVRRVD